MCVPDLRILDLLDGRAGERQDCRSWGVPVPSHIIGFSSSRIRSSAVGVCLFFASCQGAVCSRFQKEPSCAAVSLSGVQDSGLSFDLRFQCDGLGSASSRLPRRTGQEAAADQSKRTVEQIRVIGNRRIPRETVLARLFTHPGDTYDPGHDRARLQLAMEHRLL